MPRVPSPRPPLARSPTLRSEGPTREVIFADGSVAARDEVAAVARWSGLKLAVMLERYPFEWAEDREPRVPAARALVAKLAGAAKWTVMHTSMGGRDAPPAKRFARKAFDALVDKVVLQRFNANARPPQLVIRTGREDDVQYEWSLVVTDLALYLYAHDTPKNRKAMTKLFGEVRRAHRAAPWATLGCGYGGAFSSALAGVKFRWGIAGAFFDHEAAQLAPPWLFHIGALWLDVPAVRKAAEAAAARSKTTTIDADGLAITLAPPKSATDRAAPRLAAARAFSALQKRLGKLVNEALHDRAQRALILGPAKKAAKGSARAKTG